MMKFKSQQALWTTWTFILVVTVGSVAFWLGTSYNETERARLTTLEPGLTSPPDALQRSSDSLFDAWRKSLSGRLGWQDPDSWFAPVHPPLAALWDSTWAFPMDPSALGSPTGMEPRIEDAGDRLIVELDVPGLDEGSLEIEVDQNSLRVSGLFEQVEVERDAQGNIISQSSSSSSYSNRFNLPESVKPEGMTSAYENAVLKIELPKLYDEA